MPSYGQSEGGNVPSYRPQSSYGNPQDIPNNYAQPVKDKNQPSYGSGTSGSSPSGYGGSNAPSVSPSYGTSGTSAGTGYSSQGSVDSYGSPVAEVDQQQYDVGGIDQEEYGPPVDVNQYTSSQANQDYSGPSGNESPQGYNTLGQVTGGRIRRRGGKFL